MNEIMVTLLKNINEKVEIKYDEFGKKETAVGIFRHMNDGLYVWIETNDHGSYKQIYLKNIISVTEK